MVLKQNLLRNDMGNGCAADPQLANEDKYWIQNDIC